MQSVFQYWNQLNDSEKALLIILIPLLYPYVEKGTINICYSVLKLIKFLYRRTLEFPKEAFLTWYYVTRRRKPMRFVQVTRWMDFLDRYKYFVRTGKYRRPWHPPEEYYLYSRDNKKEIDNEK